MTELADLSASELRTMLDREDCSALEIIESCLARVHRLEPTVRAFVDIDEAAAIRQAKTCDGQATKGPLHGLPVAVKDTVDVAGLRCTWGTPIHAGRVPTSDAPVVARLRQAGAVILGTTVTTEYAIAKAGPTTNPHNATYSPGGSSSGSAAAVAARMVPLSVATQSVGSIIRPSSYCGIFGLKPSLGAISTAGMMQLSPHLDYVGPMARSVDDIALASAVMFDDVRTANPLAPGRMLPEGTRCFRIDGPYSERIEAPTAEALDRGQRALEAAGFDVVPVELPKRFSGLIECYETIIFKDLTERHRRDWELNKDKVSPQLLRIMEIGLAVTPAAYTAALSEQAFFREVLVELLGDGAIVLTPATDGSAPVFSERTGEQKLQSLWTVTGLPSLATPCGKLDGLPIGVQLVSAPHREDLCLSAGRLLEAVHGKDSLLAH